MYHLHSRTLNWWIIIHTPIERFQILDKMRWVAIEGASLMGEG